MLGVRVADRKNENDDIRESFGSVIMLGPGAGQNL
jgi:hypothetical protein